MAGRDALGVGVYCGAYLAYLFVYPEHELWHWLTLVGLPTALLIALGARDRPAVTVRSVLRDAGLFTRPRWTTIVAAVGIVALSIWLQFHGRRAGEIRQCFSTGAAVYLFPLSFLLAICTAASTEEFFFRGVLQSRVHQASRSRWMASCGMRATVAFAV